MRHAAVRDESSTAAADADADGSHATSHYVGLVSAAAIYRCMGLYPDDASDGQEELLEDGLLGLPYALRLHSGIDSSFDSSGGGTDTPLSNRSRVATPLMDGNSARDAGGPQQQEQEQNQHGLSQQGQHQGQISLVRLPDMVMLRERLHGHDSSVASSMCSVGSGGAGAQDSRKGTAFGASDDGDANPSGSFALGAAGSYGSSAMLPDGCSLLTSGPSDALTRYKHAASLWEVDIDDLEMLRRIGEGSFGEVMLATYRGTKVIHRAGGHKRLVGTCMGSLGRTVEPCLCLESLSRLALY